VIKLQDIKTLQKDNYKKIRVTAEKLNESVFNLSGITNLSIEDGNLSFFYKGDINQVTQILSGMQLLDVVIEEPSLEEIFIHYYE
jgi:ABC-2 type transport system ATP-binding protein